MSPLDYTTLTPLNTVLLCLAIYRITRMVFMEEGPLGICDKFRQWVMSSEEETLLQRGMNCPFCISFWVTIAFVFIPWPLVFLVGVMGGAALIFDIVG